MPVLSGTVVDGDTQQAVQDVPVTVREADGALVATGTTDAAGRFTLEVGEQLLKRLRRTGRTLRFAIDSDVHALASPVEWQASGSLDGLQLTTKRAGSDVPLPTAPEPAGGSATVVGRVAHVDGTPIRRVQVKAYHRKVGGEIELGAATTDENGRYQIVYGTQKFLPSVFVRVFAEKERLATSSLIVDAGQRARLDVAIDDARYRQPAEVDRLTRKVGPSLEGVDLAVLTADDVALLVRQTGLPTIQVTAYIAARALAARTELRVDALYALIRVLGTASLPRLLGRRAARLKGALQRAAAENMVGMDVDRKADPIVAELRRVGAAFAASPKSPGSLGKLLTTTRKARPEQNAAFVERYLAHDGPMRD